jgi:hypothetical protein
MSIRLDQRSITILAWLIATAAFAAIAAHLLSERLAHRSLLFGAISRENIFLSVLMLGLTGGLVLARWRPSPGKGGRASMALLGLLCSGAAFLFGFKGLAVVLSVFAFLDLIGYLRPPRA